MSTTATRGGPVSGGGSTAAVIGTGAATGCTTAHRFDPHRVEREQRAAQWLYTAEVLEKRLEHAIVGTTTTALSSSSSHQHKGFPGFLLSEQRSMDADRDQVHQLLLSHVKSAKRDPRRWVPDAKKEVDRALAALAESERVLDSVTDEAQELLTRIQYSDHHAHHSHNRQYPQQQMQVQQSRAGGMPVHQQQHAAVSPPQRVTSTTKPDGHPTARAASSPPSDATATTAVTGGGWAADAAKFDDFVTKYGGMSLGWPAEDHNLFLRVMLHGFDIPRTVEELMTALPHIDHQEISRHLRLYEEFLNLQRVKKAAIDAYKEQRAADAQNEEDLHRLRRHKEEVAARMTELEHERLRLRRQDALKHQVDEWREKKECEAQELVDKSRHEREVRSQAAQHNREAFKARVADQVEEFQRTKKEQAARAKLQKQRESLPQRSHSRRVTELDLQRRWYDDNERVKQRQDQIRKKDVKLCVSEQQRRLDAAAARFATKEKVGLRARATDPNERLTAPTESTKARKMLVVDDGHNCSASTARGSTDRVLDGPKDQVLMRGGSYLTPRPLHVAARAGVGWRKGL